MGVNDKVRNDLDLYKGANLGMGVYAIERSYPKVGVGQIWKQYLKQLKNYAHLCTDYGENMCKVKKRLV